MRPRTQKQPQVKKELCRKLADVDVDVKRRRLEARNFAVICIFIPFTTYDQL